MNNPSNKYSQEREIWVHCFAEDGCSNKYCADIYIPRADFKGDFEFDLGGDQTTHNFSFDALPDLCSTDADDDLFKIFVYTNDKATDSSGEPDLLSDEFATDDEVLDVYS